MFNRLIHDSSHDPSACYRALRARDARFDGRFFVAVSSTKIYCRPICRVKIPLFKNCTFHSSAAAAEHAGFRPCMKCRPELAPGRAQTEMGAALAHTAAQLIESAVAGVSPGLDAVPALALRIGVTDRHLRRIFHDAFGVSPVQYAQTQRLLLAKRLLTDTALSVTHIAFASGFSSVRRMNTLFAERYRLAPTALRKTRAVVSDDAGFRFTLGVRPPFDWPWLLAFFHKRAIPGVEWVSEDAYSRVLRIAHSDNAASCVGTLSVAFAPDKNVLTVTLSASLAPVVAAVLAHVKRVFDTSAMPDEVARVLGDLAADAPGVRVPGAFDGFELAVRAVLGQQVTVKAARTLAMRFVDAFGERVETADAALTRAFPTAARIAACTQDDVARLGIVSARANAIIDIAKAVVAGALDLSPNADLAATQAALQSIKGIGPWTAHYIAMRALSWPDAFPPQDVAILNALGLPNTKAGQRMADERAEAWRPWRSYAVMHLWRRLEQPK